MCKFLTSVFTACFLFVTLCIFMCKQLHCNEKFTYLLWLYLIRSRLCSLNSKRANSLTSKTYNSKSIGETAISFSRKSSDLSVNNGSVQLSVADLIKSSSMYYSHTTWLFLGRQQTPWTWLWHLRSVSLWFKSLISIFMFCFINCPLILAVSFSCLQLSTWRLAMKRLI